MIDSVTDKLKLIVLISGNGSNLQAIIDAIQNEELDAEITAIISNRTKAYGLERAREHEIPAFVLPSLKNRSRAEYDRELAAVINRIDAQSRFDLIVLAGFMRIFTEEFVNGFAGRMINIHPSLLPKYRGLHTHQKALDAGDHEHGCSIHFVTPELDGGPVIAQAKTLIEPEDTVLSLSARVQTQEHKLYPLILQWFAQQRIKLDDDKVILDGTELTIPYQMSIANG